MTWYIPDYAIYFILIAAVPGIISAYTYLKRKSSPSALLLSLMMLLTSFWTLFYVLELSAVSRVAQIFANDLAYIPIVSVPVVLILFLLSASGYINFLTKRRILYLSLIPALTLLLVWTSEYHTLFYRDIKFVDDGYRELMTVERGVFYWVFVIYGYLCMFAGIVITFYRAVTKAGLFRSQAIILASGTIMPWAGSILDISLGTLGHINLMQLSFVITCLLYMVGIFKFRIVDLAPVGRDTLMDRMEDFILVVNMSGIIVDANPAFLRFLGMEYKKIVGRSFGHIFSSRDDGFTLLLNEEDDNWEIPVSNGTMSLFLNVKKIPLKTQSEKLLGYLFMMHDVTVRVEQKNQMEDQLRRITSLENELREQAIRDPLTDLYNRRYQEEITSKYLAKSIRDKSIFGFMFLDIDNFKDLNDKFGHQAGDKVLVELSSILRDNVREADVICRYGGEEFLIVFPDADAAEILHKADIIRNKFESTVIHSGSHKITATFSAGIAIYPVDGDSIDDVMNAADLAMYKAKKDGKNRVVLSSDSR